MPTEDELRIGEGMIQGIERLLATGEYRRALDLCDAILPNGTLPRKFWYCRARAFEGLGEKRLAIEAYRAEIATLARVPPDLLGQVGSLLADLGDYVGAAVCLGESCEIGQSVDRLVLLAAALSRLGRLGQAREALEKALKIDPAYDEAWRNLGAYFLDVNPTEAEVAFRHAIEIDPARSDGYGGLGKACLAQGRIEEAIGAAKQGLSKNPLDGICWQVVAGGAELLGDLQGAQASFAAAFQCDYDKPAALLGLARVFERQGQPADARDLYLRGVRAWPDDARIRTSYLRFAGASKYSDALLTSICERAAELRYPSTS